MPTGWRRLPCGLALAAALAVALAAACTPGLVNPEAPPAGPPAFQEGYLHGCTAGFVDAGREGYQGILRPGDETRYRREPDYRRGFDEGSRACFEEERRRPRMCGGAELLSCP